MATWFVKGDTSIGYQILPDRKKPVFGVIKGNVFEVYGQFRDQECAEMFMNELGKFFNVERADNAADGC